MGAARSVRNSLRNAAQPAMQQGRMNTQDMPSAPMGTGGGMPLPSSNTRPGKVSMPPQAQQPVSGAGPNKGSFAQAIQLAQQQGGQMPQQPPMMPQQPPMMPQQPPMMPPQGNLPSKGGRVPPQQPPMMPPQGNLPSKGGSQMPEPPQERQYQLPKGGYTTNPLAVAYRQAPQQQPQEQMPQGQGQGQGIQGLLQMLRGRR